MDPIKFIPIDLWNIILHHAQVQVIYQISRTSTELSVLAQERLKSLRMLYSSSETAFNELQRSYSIECRTFEHHYFEKRIENQNFYIAKEISIGQEIFLQFCDAISRCPILNFFKQDFGIKIQQADEQSPYLFIAKKQNESKSEELHRKMNSIFKSLDSEQFVVVLEVEKKLILTKILSEGFFCQRAFLYRQDVYCVFKPPVLDIRVYFPETSSLGVNKQSTIILAARNVLKNLSSVPQETSMIKEKQGVAWSECTLW